MFYLSASRNSLNKERNVFCLIQIIISKSSFYSKRYYLIRNYLNLNKIKLDLLFGHYYRQHHLLEYNEIIQQYWYKFSIATVLSHCHFAGRKKRRYKHQNTSTFLLMSFLVGNHPSHSVCCHFCNCRWGENHFSTSLRQRHKIIGTIHLTLYSVTKR
jgi:hypothetical protein